MTKLKYSFAAKLIAVFLFAALIAGVFACLMVIALNLYFDFYDHPTGYTFYPMDEQQFSEYLAAHTTFSADSPFFASARGVFNMRYWCLVLGVAGAVLGILDYIFILASAGHRAGCEDIHLSFFDKIPLDLVFAADLVIGGMALSLLFEELWDSFAHSLNTYGYQSVGEMYLMAALICAVLIVVGLTVLFFSQTFAARVKAGTLWRNNITAFALRGVWYVVKRIFGGVAAFARALPLVWKTVLFAGGLCLLIFLDVSVRDAVLFFLICGVIMASAVFASCQMVKLKRAAERLAAGDLDYKLDTKGMFWEFKKHGENLNAIGDGMARAVEERTRSERLKAELITNVSHDIKTPLTSIINYIDLMQKTDAEEERAQYLDVLARQSARLKKLTEDLVEASKASTGALAVELAPTNTDEIIHQALAEYGERLAAANLTVVYDAPETPITVLADGRHLWRTLDNLLSNAVKYAMPGTRVYIDCARAGERAVVSVKNISRDRLNIPAEELMERFVRGDSARTTAGSGLGLNIAMSLTELMGGHFSLTVDGDLFKAEVALKVC